MMYIHRLALTSTAMIAIMSCEQPDTLSVELPDNSNAIVTIGDGPSQAGVVSRIIASESLIEEGEGLWLLLRFQTPASEPSVFALTLALSEDRWASMLDGDIVSLRDDVEEQAYIRYRDNNGARVARRAESVALTSRSPISLRVALGGNHEGLADSPPHPSTIAATELTFTGTPDFGCTLCRREPSNGDEVAGCVAVHDPTFSSAFCASFIEAFRLDELGLVHTQAPQ